MCDDVPKGPSQLFVRNENELVRIAALCGMMRHTGIYTTSQSCHRLTKIPENVLSVPVVVRDRREQIKEQIKNLQHGLDRLKLKHRKKPASTRRKTGKSR